MRSPLYLVGFDPISVAALLDPSRARVECGPGIAERQAGDWLALVVCPHEGPERWIAGVVRMAEQGRNWNGRRTVYVPEQRIAFEPVPLSLERFRDKRPLEGELLRTVRRLCGEARRRPARGQAARRVQP